MRYEITFPVNTSVQGRATVGRWRKEIGDSIRTGEVVLAIETSTTVLEIESEVEGMLADIFFETGVEAKLGGNNVPPHYSTTPVLHHSTPR